MGGASHGQRTRTGHHGGVGAAVGRMGDELSRHLRHELELVLDRLRDARRMAAMLGRTAGGGEVDPRVEILEGAVEATVEDLTSIRDRDLAD